MTQPAFDGDAETAIAVVNGFHPTPGKPIPAIRCTFRFREGHDRAGERCKRWSIRGTTVCYRHGGNLPRVQEHAAAVVDAARLRLVESADDAVDWLLDLGRNSPSDAVRLKAATEVLDRVGVRGGSELNVNVDVGGDPGQALRDRLSTIRSRVIDVTPEPAGDTLANVRTASEEEDVD